MFKGNKQEVFSLRKYKNGRTDSKLIGATILALGIGLVTTTHSVSADVVNGAGGSEVALVDSVDKTTSTNTNTFTDNTDTNKTAKFDAVLNKGVAEPTKANENKGEADGTDTVTVTSETTVNYKLEEDNSLLKTETVATGQGTITTPYDKKGLAADTDGKDYRKSTVDKTGITVSEETGKQDTLELNGKVYERTRSEVEGADKAKYSKTQFNDIEASVSPEGMHNKLGEIDYTKTTGKVYLVEETADGQYGKFVETNGVSSDEDAVAKWKAGLANAKDFTKANVTLQEGDSILVLDKDTYAVASSKTIKNKKVYNGFTFGRNPYEVNVDNDSSFSNPTFSLAGMGVSEIIKAGSDGIFGTSDDVVESVTATSGAITDFYTGFDYGFSPDLYEDNPFFKPSTHAELPITSTPSELEALKNHPSYTYLNDLIKFAEKEATSEADKSKVAEVKRKFEAKLQENLNAIKAKGYDLVYVKNSNSASNIGRYVFKTPVAADLSGTAADALDDKLSPSRELSELFTNLTFTNVSESTTESPSDHNLDLTTRVEKKYTVGSTGEISMEKTTTITGTFKVTKGELVSESNLLSVNNSETDYSELVKSGDVTVKDDGSVVIKSTETGPVNHFYNGDPDYGTEIFSDTNEFRFPSADNEGLTLGAVSEKSHNETTYNKREVITPIRAYKVVADGTSTVTHYYREKKAPLNVNYYLENTTTSLAPSENQADLPVKSDYTTQAKEIPSKTEVQDLPEKTVTTVTTYELVATPTNATGKIVEGGTTVNYFYRAVEKVTEVAKQAPVTVNYYLEGTTDKLAPSDDQGQKDIGSAYTTETKTIAPKVVTQDLEYRVITTTTTYELVSEPTDKNGIVPVGGKVVNYFYREVVNTETVMKKAPVVANYYLEGTETKLADSDNQGEKEINSQYTTEKKEISPKVEVQDLEDRTITKTTTYELVSEPSDKAGSVPVGGKTVNYFYRAVVKEDVVMKQAPVTVNYFKEGTTEKLADTIEQGQKNIGSNYTTESKTIPNKVDVQDLEDRVVTTTTSYELVAEPTDKEGIVPVGGKIVNYFYREVVNTETVMKKAPVVANYYIEGTSIELAASDNQGDQNIGSDYTTSTKVIEPRTVVETEDGLTVTRTVSYELVENPSDKDGKVPVGGKFVNYYYREVVEEVAKPNEAPKVEVPEYNEPIGTVPNDAPKVDIPEYNEPIGTVPNEAPKVEVPEYNEPIGSVPNDAPKVELPEYNEPIGSVPNDAPKVEIPEYNEPIGTVPNYAPKVEIPEYNEPIGTVPNDAPKVEIPEYNESIGIPGIPEIHEKPEYTAPIGVPGTPEVHEKPELVIPEVPTKPVEPSKPVSVENNIPVKEDMLPNTGGGDSSILSLLGGLSLTTLLGFVSRKRKED